MIDLRFVKRDGKMILQFRNAIDLKSDKSMTELLQEQLIFGTAFNCVSTKWDKWQDVRIEEENETSN